MGVEHWNAFIRASQPLTAGEGGVLIRVKVHALSLYPTASGSSNTKTVDLNDS